MVFSILFQACAFYGLTLAGNLIPQFSSTLRQPGTAGCGTHHTVDGVSRDFEVLSNGRNRTYRIHLPSSYDPNVPAPLVFSYHGHGQDMVKQETLSQFSNDAINPNMIAVYPQGLKGAVSKTILYVLRQSSEAYQPPQGNFEPR